jgi:hypothetical protein
MSDTVQGRWVRQRGATRCYAMPPFELQATGA